MRIAWLSSNAPGSSARQENHYAHRATTFPWEHANQIAAMPPRTESESEPERELPASSIGAARTWALNDADPDPSGRYVLYWCRAYRRPTDNLALDHAARRANELHLPLLVYEALDVRYPHANDRIHTFVLEGAAGMRAALEARNAAYVFYLPRSREESARSRALESLARDAAIVVTDWYPDVGGRKQLWRHTASMARRVHCAFEAIDDACIVPMSLLQKPETNARTLRPKILRSLPACLDPAGDLSVRAPRLREIDVPFAPIDPDENPVADLVRSCEIDHTVAPVTTAHGGAGAAAVRLREFVQRSLRHYAVERSDVARSAGSRLSPYLHFGHLSARAALVAARDSGANLEAIEAFTEQLVVRRTLSFNHVIAEPAHGTFDVVPAWAKATLARHAIDSRLHACDFETWEQARTADAIWNAAQHELLRDGVIHNQVRMLWGKVALTLTARPEDAFAWLVKLNDKYALDGRDPNTYASIAWCFGLHDRPFPERAVFGTVRSMTSASMARKFDVHAYFARVGAPGRAVHGDDEFDQRTRWDE